MSYAQWQERNQAHVVSAISEVRAALARHLQVPAPAPLPSPEWEEGLPPPAIDVLQQLFGLSPFEKTLLLFCAGPELDGELAGMLAAQKLSPSFGLALAALPAPHWSALSPGGPLRAWRLLEVSAGSSLVTSTLKIDERLLHFITGVSYLDERLRAWVEPLPSELHLPVSHKRTAQELGRLWMSGALVEICAEDAASTRAVAAQACWELGLRPYVLRAAELPGAIAEREGLGRLWEREALLSQAALLLEIEEDDSPETLKIALSFAERLRSPALLGAREPLRARHRPLVRLSLQRPTAAERQELWRTSLGEDGNSLNGALSRVLHQFELSSSSIFAVGASLQNNEAQEALGDQLWEACRAQARPRLDGLAQRISTMVGWEDLVLPTQQTRLLRDLASQLKQRTRVYEQWGFSSQSSRGLGLSALFSGASGTGKTMAAEVIAKELSLDLYRIDLSSVVSKYIGETEKNLRRVFDAAESGGAVLLFDEADALFGKRSEVKDSHDRYANIEVGYLLQRMEAYRGLAILTTNLKSSIDTAFLRRLRFIVQFPFPDAQQRADIWRRIFPQKTPTEGLDYHRLAQLNITGGNIRNIALYAAFLAAEADSPVRMEHLLRAARIEYAKLEMSLTENEIKGWL